MASGGCLLLCLLVVLSVFLTPGHCGYQQIDLQSSDVQCNMSTVYYNSGHGRSMDCNGAINENTDTIWKNRDDRNPNCVYTEGRANEYWLLNLGKQYNIHRVTIYPETRWDHMKNISVLVDDTEIFRFPWNKQITHTVRITGGQLPRRGRFIRLTKSSPFVTLCELQVDECTTDSYGVDCEETCSPGCRANGDSTTCDSISGNCTRGCRSNWWGGRCNMSCVGCTECQDNFAPPDCQGCTAGWHGSMCDTPCSTNCLPENDGAVRCGQDDGLCTAECRTGWYGSECEKPCSEHCKPDTDGDRRCAQTDGVCNSGCVNGWYGLHCNGSCPPNCDGRCGREDGVCNNCTTSWYGPDCTVQCPVNCNGGCQQADGVCNGCRNGYFGPRCQSPCGTGCVDNCNREDGACNCSTGWSSPNCAECDTGYYGVESCEECGYCRDGDVCNNHNGHCPRGCRAGFHGDRCDKCASNRWGFNCSLPCGQCAGDGSCDVHTGYCTSGCLQGFEGDNCTLKLASGEDDTPDGGNNAGPLVGGLLGAGALIGISVLLAAFMIIRWRRSRDTSKAADTDGAHFSSGDAPVRDVTEGDKSETETPGNESNYAQLEKYENPDDIRPYSMLQDGGKLPIYRNIQSDQETAVYQNTTVSKN